MGEEQGKQAGRWLERLPVATNRPGLALAATLAIVGASLAIRLAAEGVLPIGYPYVAFFPAVIISAFLFGIRMGVVAGVVAGLLAWYFFIPPLRSFAVGPGAPLALGFYAMVVGIDIAIIHWLQRANRRLARERERNRLLAETRETLFRELQHRVSNNLQVIAGLLALQKKHVADDAAREALDVASQRLAVIGRISRQLYDVDGGMRSMRAFLEPLCRDVIETSGRAGVAGRVTAGDEILLEPSAAIPVALIVAEAVANAIEHGFAGREHGQVEIELRRDGTGALLLEVHDDGHGLPAGFDLRTSASLGLRIAMALAEQLDGRFEMTRGDRTTARLVLP